MELAKLQSNTSISKSTIDTYSYGVKRIQQLMPNKDLLWIANHHKEVAKELMKLESRNTIINSYDGMLALLKAYDINTKKPKVFALWKTASDALKAAKKEEWNSSEPSKKDVEKHVPWNDVLEARDKLVHGSRDHLLLSMYTMIPPRRQMDYHLVYVKSKRENIKAPETFSAVLDLYAKPPVISFYLFKTANKNDPTQSVYTHELTPELVKVIHKSLELMPRKYLFVDSKGNVFNSTNSFQKYSNGRFKKLLNNPKASVDSLRHSWATFRSLTPRSVAEWKQDSLAQGHSVETHIGYAKKFSADMVCTTKCTKN